MAQLDYYTTNNGINRAQGQVQRPIISRNINTNRTIEMHRSGITGGAGSWKNSLSNLLGSQPAGRKERFISSSRGAYSEWNVDPNVYLLMDTIKGLATNNTPEYPIKQLTSKIGNGKGIAGKIANVATLIAEGADALNNLTRENGMVTGGVWDPWISNLPAFREGSVPDLTYTFKFSMGQYGLWNAKEEVVKPILNLLAPTMPQYVSACMMGGNFPTAMQLLATAISKIFNPDSEGNSLVSDISIENPRVSRNGNNITVSYDGYTGTFSNSEEFNAWKESEVGQAFMDSIRSTAYANTAEAYGSEAVGGTSSTKKNTESAESEESSTIYDRLKNDINELAEKLEDALLAEYKNYTFDITFGNVVTYYNMLPLSSKVTFGSEVDQYGYPTSGEIEIQFKGLAPTALSAYNPNQLAVRFGKGV